MTAFNVLDRRESIRSNLLLEASAGTGKTFAIENIVMRMLLEPGDRGDPLLIEDILVVTFTKAAARELKERVRSTLVDGLGTFKRALSGIHPPSNTHDYLLSYIEAGSESVKTAIKRVERALYCYDKCQIFTIHAFCWRMLSTYALEAGISLDSQRDEDGGQADRKRELAVRDFLKGRLSQDKYLPAQLESVIRSMRSSEDKFIQAVISHAGKPHPIRPGRAMDVLGDLLRELLLKLRNDRGFCKIKLLEDLERLKPFYKNSAKFQSVHFERLASLFDKDEWLLDDLDLLLDDGAAVAEFLGGKNRMVKRKAPLDQLNYPDLADIIEFEMAPLIAEALSDSLILARISSDCQRFINEYESKEEMLGHDGLLAAMKDALANDEFVRLVRHQYAAAIVDEFQDTDPLQWQIFSRLFTATNGGWDGCLFLVGDPKQSIYAFRQADIYTYLQAADALGADAHYTLDTNYRSTPALVEALNHLFESIEDPFPLPRNGVKLPFRPVKAGVKAEEEAVPSRSLQFWVSAESSSAKVKNAAIESGVFLPQMAKELLRLKSEEGMKFSECAVLVSDHKQGARVSEYLRSCNIPVRVQRGVDLNESSVVEDMIDLLYGISDGGVGNSLKIALSSRPVGMTVSDLQCIGENDRHVFLIRKFQELRTVLNNEGFGLFHRRFLQTSWHGDGRSVIERLLAEQGGADYLRDWQDLADWLTCEEHRLNLSPAEVVAHLEMLVKNDEESEGTKAYVDLNADGVSVMTIHISKGLEFGAVFPLGVCSLGTERTNELIPVYENGKYHLSACLDREDRLYINKTAEDDAEKLRKLYVALTRAKKHLYIPVIPFEKKESKAGSAVLSPIELFLGKLGRGDQGSQGDIVELVGNLVSRNPGTMSLTILQPANDKPVNPVQVEDAVLVPPNDFVVPGAQEYLQSFTSLTSSLSHANYEELEELPVPHDYDTEVKTCHTLPSGNETGTLLHKILEEVPFDILKGRKTSGGMTEFVKPYVRGTRFEPWLSTIAGMVEKVLQVPLPGFQGTYSLSEIDPAMIFKETEFLYPCGSGDASIDSSLMRPGFLKGVIDLFYKHDGRYYILDWKSNWLGPDDSFYGEERLKDAMRANKYDLQAVIYAEAMRRFLKVYDKRPFEEIFGGIYYIFLRGTGQGNGILHFYPSIGEVADG